MRMRACVVVHACVMRACVWSCIAVRACACTCGLFARACMHARMCLCVYVPCTGDYRLVSSSAAQGCGGRGRGIFSSRTWGTFVTHPTLRRCTQGSHALPRASAIARADSAGRTQSRSPHPEPDILCCDKRGWRCAFCVGMPAWHRSAGADLAARRSPVLRAPPSANSCTKLFHRVQLKFGVIGRSSSSPWARWADLRDWNRSDVLLQLLDVHTWGRNQL